VWPTLRVAVVGHVEWIEFGLVDRVPEAGGIAHAKRGWEEPGGGGGVAAVQLVKLAGSCDLFTAVGDDPIGRRMVSELGELGVRVHTAVRDAPTRRAITLVDDEGERTIVTVGERLRAEASDPLPWERLAGMDAVYVTAGDPGAFAAARGARTVVVASRDLGELLEAGMRPDALVGSSADRAEDVDLASLPWPPPLIVRTSGRAGGSFRTDDGTDGAYPPAPLPGPVVDTYGGGDAFAAGLTFALGAGRPVAEAIAFAASCGAAAVTGRGPFAGQRVLVGWPANPGQRARP
jgi:ribokinase